MFVLGFSLSWCSRCFCQVCSITFTPVLPVGAAPELLLLLLLMIYLLLIESRLN